MTAGIVIAGGRSTRFDDGDKALATVGGVPMLRRVVDGLVPLVDRVVVSARPDQRSAFASVLGDVDCRLDYAVDRQPDGGPVAGLAAALGAVDDAEAVLVLACDLPLVRTAALRELRAQLDGGDSGTSHTDGHTPDCVVPRVEGRRQPLCGAYRRAALAAAIDALETPRDASLTAVLEGLDAASVEAACLPNGATVFENVNTRADLDAVRDALGES